MKVKNLIEKLSKVNSELEIIIWNDSQGESPSILNCDLKEQEFGSDGYGRLVLNDFFKFHCADWGRKGVIISH